MKTYDISKAIDIFDVPFCPLCDNEITEMDEPAYGICSNDSGLVSLCLIHESCGEELRS
jgi:hypothetical protein